MFILKINILKSLSILFLGILLLLLSNCTTNKQRESPVEIIKNFKYSPDLVIRFARLEIDSTRIDEYFEFLIEGIETSIDTEPGVLTMYGVQERKDPNKVTILEIYLNDSAYQSHLRTAHFQKYKTGTMEMVKSLELVDLDPVVFGVRNE